MPDLILTGLSQANVVLADGGVVFVRRDEALPPNLKDGEEERLRKLGAFDPFPERVLPPGTVERTAPGAMPEILSENPAEVAAMLSGTETPTPEQTERAEAEADSAEPSKAKGRSGK
jgi:hypothetical protein